MPNAGAPRGRKGWLAFARLVLAMFMQSKILLTFTFAISFHFRDSHIEEAMVHDREGIHFCEIRFCELKGVLRLQMGVYFLFFFYLSSFFILSLRNP